LLCDVAHRVSVNWIVSRNRQCANAVRHDDMTTVSYKDEPGLLQRSNRRPLINTGDFRHRSNGHFSSLNFNTETLFDLWLRRQIFADGVLDILQRFFTRGAL